MQVPYSWIKEFVDVSWTPEELVDRLTHSGAEAETTSFINKEFDNIVVGRVVELENIEGTDHLKKAVVDTGNEKLQVVCGAPNVAEDQKIVIALKGAKLKNGMEIKKVKLRGVESYGMICSEAELGLSDDHSGIIVLDDNASLGIPIKDHLKLDDPIIKLDLTPNRPDLMSAIGVARDIACLTGQKIKRPKTNLIESKEKTSDDIKISIDDINACPRYAARIIKDVKIGPSPWWIKRKLLLSGIRPISNIVDITNFVMMEYGQPLHAFDYDLFKRKEILVRRATNGEKFTTLDNKEHELTPDVLLITNGETAVAVAGVMGGLESEVSNKTVNILLESAFFDPITIRKSRKHLGINSESSIRFEKKADPNIVITAINRAAFLMAEYAEGKILSGVVDCYPEEILPARIKLRPERMNALMGTNISRERIVNILKGLEFGVDDKEILEVTVPTFTGDITREVDLIEEVIRIEGFDKVPISDQNRGPLFSPRHKEDIFRDDIRRIMTAQGFDEIYSPGLADQKLLSRVSGNKPQIKVLNPISDDLTVMVNSQLYALLKAVSHNIAHRNINLRLFEIGRNYFPGNPPQEEEEISIAVTGKSGNKWYQERRDYDFYDLKGAVDFLIEKNRIPPVIYSSCENKCFRNECSYELQLNDNVIGYAGLIEREIARLFNIKQDVYAVVLAFSELLVNIRPEVVYRSLPRFPAAPRDLAVVVDESVYVGEFISVIQQIGGSILEKVELFDLFRGKQLGEGKKSLAFSMIYRSKERSLENEEVAEIHNRIADKLREQFKAEVREV